MRHAVIMAGGSGTRLWPLSRAGRPKQLLDIVASPVSGPDGGAHSLLAEAWHRLAVLLGTATGILSERIPRPAGRAARATRYPSSRSALRIH